MTDRRTPNKEFVINTLTKISHCSATLLIATLPIMAKVLPKNQPMSLLPGLAIAGDLMIMSSGMISIFEISALERGVSRSAIANCTTALSIVKTVINIASKSTVFALWGIAALLTLEHTIGKIYANTIGSLTCAAILAWKYKPTLPETTTALPSLGEMLLRTTPMIVAAGLSCIVGLNALTIKEPNQIIERS